MRSDTHPLGKNLPRPLERLRSISPVHSFAWVLLVSTIVVIAFAIHFGSTGVPTPRVLSYRQLSDDGKLKIGPLLSDGSYLYFQEDAQSGQRTARVPFGGGAVTFLDEGGDGKGLIGIAPNGDRLLARAMTRDPPELWYWSLAAGTLRPLNIRIEFGASVSPDQRLLATSSSSTLQLLDLKSGRLVTNILAPGQVRYPRWSSDGKMIRFDSYDLTKDTFSILEVSLKGGTPQPVFPAWSSAPSACCAEWTPDGRYILFEATDAHGTDLWIADQQEGAAVGRPVRLTRGPLNFRWPLSGSSAETVFAIGEKSRAELVKVDKNGAFTPFLAGRHATELSFSRDGQSVAFVDPSDRTLWTSALDGTRCLRLTSPPLLVYQPQWSPDGRSIAFMGKSAIRWAIYVVTASGGPTYQPLPEGSDQGVPTFAPDGNSVVFGDLLYRKEPAAMGIHLLDLNSRKLTTLPGSQGKWTPRWSPDGRFIVAQSTDWHKLWLFDLATASWSALLDFASIDNPTWSLDSAYVYFNGRAVTHDPASIYRLHVRDRKLETMFQLGTRWKLEDNWCGVAPDGSPLFLRAVSHQEIYALQIGLK